MKYVTMNHYLELQNTDRKVFHNNFSKEIGDKSHLYLNRESFYICCNSHDNMLQLFNSCLILNKL